MSSIIIKELYDADDIFGLVEKVNFNFDQLLAAGGGPEGPIGPTGPTGPAGIQGIRGSEWFAATGATGTINVPTDGELRENDFRLEDNGDIEYYDGANWVLSGINIQGPAGPAGPAGDGAISILHTQVSLGGNVVPNVSLPGKLTLSDHLLNIDPTNDEDDTVGSDGYIDAGADYIALGYGNNSLVLGHYLSLFRDNGIFNPKFALWPTEEKDIPMLIVAQNDYLDPMPGTPTDTNQEYENGLLIGLNMTQGNLPGDYDAIYNGVPFFGDYRSFTKLRTINRNHDFAVDSPGHIELRSYANTNRFRLSAGFARAEIKTITDINQWANIFSTNSYTQIDAGDNFAINDTGSQDPIPDPGVGKQFIATMGNISLSSNSPVAYTGKLMDSINSTVFGKNSNPTSTSKNANEIIIVNDKVEVKETRVDKYNNRYKIDPKVYTQRDSNNYKDTQLRFGQIRTPNTSSASAKNFFYLGQAYDAPIIGYSSVNYRIASGSYSLNGGTASAYSLLPANGADVTMLGYNIINGFAPGGLANVESDKSLTRLGIFPGFLNQKRDAAGNLDPSDPNGDANMDYYLDEGHKKLPTGSLDLYGTVRIREYGLAEDKTGYVAVNAGHGIVKWENSNKVGVPTGGIVMVSELAMSKFNFFTRVSKAVGSFNTPGGTSNSGLAYWAYKYPAIGSTAAPNGWTAAFPGKGSDDWEGYYICNGAVLADTRDIFARGAFSTQTGLKAYGTNQPIPVLQTNPNYTHYSSYNGNYYMNNAGNFVSNNASRFKTNLINKGNSVAATFGGEGYSLLAPSDTDSGFRVVLPNYFGRFPKQVLPSSEVIYLNNRDDSQPFIGGVRKPITTYYKLNGAGKYVINDKYPLHSGFYDGGFPYVRKENIPIHEHYTGSRGTARTGDGATFDYVNSGLDGAGFDNYAPGARGSGDNNSTGAPMTGTETKDRAGYTGMVTPGMEINSGADPLNDNYFINNDYRQQAFSNQLNDVFPVNSFFRGRSQKFHDPVFKGTYFAINLRGMLNPNRGDTIIPDFDFVAGVPMAGYRNANSGLIDYSWYSNAADLRAPAIITTPDQKGRGINQYIINTLSGPSGSITGNISPFLGNEAIDTFVPIYRNENTYHPSTMIRTSDTNWAPDLQDVYENIYVEPKYKTTF